MVFLVTTLLLIGYGLNLLVSIAGVISSDDPRKRGMSVLAIFIGLAASAGVIYLAAN